MKREEQLALILDSVEEPKSDLDVYDETDFRFVFAVILSSQTTDVQVNKVCPKLFETFPTLESFAKANWEDVAVLINSLSFYRNKAKNLVKCAQQLIENHNGIIPDNLSDLEKLAGCGRKVSNVILNCVHNKPGIVVDTHVLRVANRLGWVDSTNPKKVELALDKWIPKETQAQASNSLVLFGRYICQAKKPQCQTYKLASGCKFRNETK